MVKKGSLRFLLIRFLSAVCNEAADLAAYVLCMEITGTKYRAMVGSFLQAPWAIGYALLAAVAYLTKSWRIMQIITAALHTVTILLICVLPESPRWLIVNSRVSEAERIIRKACRMNKSQLPADLELVKHAENRLMVKRHQRAHLGHLLQSRILLMRTGIIFVVWIATALVYYGLVIALSDQSGPGRSLFSGNFFVNNAVAGAIELPTLLGCVFLLRFGRKRSQMSTLIGSGLMIIAGSPLPHHHRRLPLPHPHDGGRDGDAGHVDGDPADVHDARQGLHPGRLQYSLHLHFRALSHCTLPPLVGRWVM